MSEKRVLIVSYQYPPEGGSSGVLRALKYSKYLPRHGWIPHVLTLRESFYPIRDETLRAQIPPEAVLHRTHAFDSARHLSIRGRYPSLITVPDRFITWLPFGITAGWRAIRKYRIRAIFSTSPPPTTHLIGAGLHRLTGVPWIADFRDPWIEEGFHPTPGTLRDRVERRLERGVLRSATRVVATTPRLRDELVHRHPMLDPAKMRVIYNGYDETDFASLPRPSKSLRFELLHAGLVTSEFRDPLPLLRAIASLTAAGAIGRDSIRLTFLGGGPYVEGNTFRGILQDLELADIVHVADRVSHSDALGRLQEAAVLLLLQASDDTRTLIPAKAFEYLRLPRPILALTLDGATSDVLREAKNCVVVDPANETALHRAILDLYHDWIETGGEALPARRVDRFDRASLTEQLARLLDEIGARDPLATPDQDRNP